MLMPTRLLGLGVLTAVTAGIALLAACVGDAAGGDAGAADASDSSAQTETGQDGGGCDGGSVCGSACVDPKSDPHNCGGCGVTCASDAGAVYACVQGACGNKAVQVSTGYYGACALLLDGTVWCWGRQAAGETGKVDPSPTPVPAKIAIDSVVEVRTGREFACARKSDGTVWCWGDNQAGMLGHAPGTDPACAGTCSPTPVQIALPAKAAQLSASFLTACALTQGATGGDVYCWGDSFAGILGGGTPDAGSIGPTPKKIPVFLSDVLEIAMSGHDNGAVGDRPMACAIRNDHTVWCWGSNWVGGLGHAPGTSGDAVVKDLAPFYANGTPNKVTSLTDVAHVTVGGAFACAVTTGGAAWCWGDNRDGYLGAGTVDVNPHPTPSQVLGLNTAKAVAAGDLSVFVLDSTGGVKAWGGNGYGNLGIGNYDGGSVCNDFACFSSPQAVPLLQGVTQISAINLSQIALKADGTILTWGVNPDAELGHAPSTNGDTACGTNSAIACNPTPGNVVAPWR
jgi:alpha-tubulin suppressor-like RCC1 family protein